MTVALTDGWGHLTRERGKDFKLEIEEWRTEQGRIAADLVVETPDAAKTLEFLRERLEAIRQQPREHSSVAVFVSVLTESRPQLAAVICEAVLNDARVALRDIFGQSLYQLSKVDPSRALKLAKQALGLSDIYLQRDVAWAYGARLGSANVLPEERAFVEKLVQNSDDFTVIQVLQGVSGQAATERSWTIATLLGAPIERSARIGDEVFGSFARPNGISLDSLDDAMLGNFLKKLAACPSLDNHWIGEFLQHAALKIPGPLVQVFIDRIDKDGGDTERSFDPAPFSLGSHTRLDFRADPQFHLHLKAVREWLLAAPRTAAMIVYGPKLYAAIAREFDQVVLADLDAWVKSGDAKKLAVIGRILSDAPPGFVFDQKAFVVDLLERAAGVSKECVDGLSSSLWSSAISGVRHGTPGTPFPEDEARRDRSTEVLTQVPRNSPAWSLYNSLRQNAEVDIRHKHEEDEELFGE